MYSMIVVPYYHVLNHVHLLPWYDNNIEIYIIIYILIKNPHLRDFHRPWGGGGGLKSGRLPASLFFTVNCSCQMLTMLWSLMFSPASCSTRQSFISQPSHQAHCPETVKCEMGTSSLFSSVTLPCLVSVQQSDHKRWKAWLVGGKTTPLKNMKVSWDDYSQYMESHNPVMFQSPPTSWCSSPGPSVATRWSEHSPLESSHRNLDLKRYPLVT